LKRDRKVLVIESAACGGRGSGRGTNGGLFRGKGVKVFITIVLYDI